MGSILFRGSGNKLVRFRGSFVVGAVQTHRFFPKPLRPKPYVNPKSLIDKPGSGFSPRLPGFPKGSYNVTRVINKVAEAKHT